MIFEKAGFKDSDAQNFASVGVGAFNVLMTVVSVSADRLEQTACHRERSDDRKSVSRNVSQRTFR